MTTSVTTITKSAEVFTRTWTDLDPKVRNALGVWALTLLSAGTAFASGRITLYQALGFLVPVTLAVAVAYVTTSKHKKVIREAVTAADEVAHDVAPLVKVLAPETEPVIDAALDAVDTINAALTQPAGLPAPVPAPAQ